MIDSYPLIRRTEFFNGLSEPGCRRLADLSHPLTIPKRDLLFMEGSSGRAVYLLVNGSIQLIKSDIDGRETVIKTVKPGELFAEVILFEAPRYPVTAAAVTDAEVLEFPRGPFLKLLDEPEFRNDFMAMLMRRQRYLAERIQQTAVMNVEDRLRAFLREHCGEAPSLPITLSKKDTAAAIGTTPETFSRLLQRLEQSGELIWTGRTIRVRPSFWDQYS